MAVSQPRTRSLRGCVTCRTRHFKCDEVRPVCGNCRDLNIECLGYLNRITFVLEGQANVANNDQSRLRRPLFTEQERFIMSNNLVASTGLKTASQILADIDDGPTEISSDVDFEKSCGPFGVFSLGQPGSNSSLPPQDFVDDMEPVADTLDVSILDDLNRLWDDQTTRDAGVFSDFDLTTFEPMNMAQFEEIVQTNDGLGDDQSIPVLNQRQPLDLTSIPSKDAPFLLTYYKETVVPLLSPALRKKNVPWVSLHLRFAKEALVNMMMGVECNSAQQTVFSALLSMASYHLSATQDDPEAAESLLFMAHKHRADAFSSLKQTLHDAIVTRKKAKYKEILTALLSVLDIGVFHGDFNTSQTLLLDTERLIRLRGLPKVNKSRKIRLLHHCYAFSRIFHESLAGISDHEIGMQRIVELESSPPSGSDAFRVPDWEGVFDTEMTREKSFELGHNDLHLEVPGRWSPTLYPDIYGVPEDFLLLLSAATRLGNERDLAHSSPSQQTCTWPQFNSRAKMVERCILNWDPSPREQSSSEDNNPDGETDFINRPVIVSHLRSMQQALIIYFYRRVYDINPVMLQSRMLATLEALNECREVDSRLGTCTTLFVWPAIIAACESLDAETQNRWIQWFDSSYDVSRLFKFRRAKEVAQQVWSERARSCDPTVDWMKFCRTRRIQFICI